ncbi:MAG: class B sortase [Roseburia sp.]|nr:class B sortase [Roseburia sp.]
MEDKVYIVDGRQFRTKADQERALQDKRLIERLRQETSNAGPAQKEKLISDIRAGRYPFKTLLGQDFADELEDGLQKRSERKSEKKAREPKKNDVKRSSTVKEAEDSKSISDKKMDAYVQEELKRRERRRKLLLAACSILAVVCLGCFGVYSYQNYRTERNNQRFSSLKEMQYIGNEDYGGANPGVYYTLDAEEEPREVLEEFKNLLNKNKRLIGWLKIDDTNIDYPVMQTVDNEYYLDHNLNQEYDKNGSIFMDKDCDVINPSTNYILYGHHMKSGQMFGKLDLYSGEQYGEEHKYIQFDTIYEKGLYQVMYVFRSRVYSEEEVNFKYYQFIDALSEQEFDSYMKEMAAVSLYDTGVTAQYGDQLLTLSTCDYQETNGRFVVVAKKVTAKE